MITRWEKDLIKRFGYPFEDIERQLAESGDADLARVTDVPFYWEQLILNLRISTSIGPADASRLHSLLPPSFGIFRIHLTWLLPLQYSRINCTNTHNTM